MDIASAIFHCSAPDLDSCPDESLPEFAFIGRSNVGKSSLLNMLAGKQGLARVSPTPGFTKLINIFTINGCWRLVDLPGYGFAEGSKKVSRRFNTAVSNYLKHRTNLCLVFALIDSALPPQAMDLEFVEWLVHNDVPFVLAFTKMDKSKTAAAQANIAAFMEAIAPWFVQPPATFTCSSQTGQGRAQLLGVIQEAMDAIQVEAKASSARPPAPKGPVRMPESRKKRVALNRPW